MQLSKTNDYTKFLANIKSRICLAKISAARQVNNGLISLYWSIGHDIVEKQKTLGWGKSVVEKLSKDLQKAFPNSEGYSADNLWRMRQFYTEYSNPTILEQLVPELTGTKTKKVELPILERLVPEWRNKIKSLNNKKKPLHWEKMIGPILANIPWGHHVLILKKIKSFPEKLYYLKATTALGWSRDVLLNQIKADSYCHFIRDSKASNFKLALPAYLAEQAEETLKSSYNLEFLGIKEAIHERHLENRLIEKLKNFILELGYGFCFIGNQYRLTLGENEYFIDLLFYHRFLKSLVAVELKTGKFKPEYAGKMDFYLNLLNESEKANDDRPSIGIILCAERDKLEVEFSLRTKINPIGVAEYKLYQSLPDNLKGKLPTSKQLIEGLK
ncbi:MAG: hypothetical protein A3G32_00835 [Deltaproteobacteria bacterium RIFCSPLOWO2_12_FULL_40_28]|nr:MAG: hypothetical protein A3C45_09720 [Deltaproteobacteria bacterium RIFCSPHIGHO2_02_FULL_40_28]OGQ19885.1 MAG: hypothetical protein A3E27_06670 [Deltaproteobacteria bacterium RIFCSPHIGHO2_12_FULL_40_32]OGQ39644.1 MAG: hypothetical protein A3I69_06100 [Deltaproteobacteria bacterium RIFCSPLOWO2_02_FULL_40_36]OGQ52900.1 MAG: hypothetical protein A3G32_00835 [Deltaproteobacteria bacterium RIFCSPLOWO2_12_FULL_40_28]